MRAAGRAARALGALVSCMALPASAEDLVMSLGADRIAIRSNFTGAAVSVVGVIGRDANTVPRAADYDVVITVRGPRGAVTVWRKQKWGLFWLNLEQAKFIAVPSFISVLSNRPLDLIVNEGLRTKQRIGIESQIPEQGANRGDENGQFRRALERLRGQTGLFLSKERAVRFITPNVVQARIEIPGRAPLGEYNVDLALFADGALLARQQGSFQVIKAGAEQAFSIAARDASFLYAIVATLLALFFGWLANAIFRRD